MTISHHQLHSSEGRSLTISADFNGYDVTYGTQARVMMLRVLHRPGMTQRPGMMTMLHRPGRSCVVVCSCWAEQTSWRVCCGRLWRPLSAGTESNMRPQCRQGWWTQARPRQGRPTNRQTHTRQPVQYNTLHGTEYKISYRVCLVRMYRRLAVRHFWWQVRQSGMHYRTVWEIQSWLIDIFRRQLKTYFFKLY